MRRGIRLVAVLPVRSCVATESQLSVARTIGSIRAVYACLPLGKLTQRPLSDAARTDARPSTATFLLFRMAEATSPGVAPRAKSARSNRSEDCVAHARGLAEARQPIVQGRKAAYSQCPGRPGTCAVRAQVSHLSIAPPPKRHSLLRAAVTGDDRSRDQNSLRERCLSSPQQYVDLERTNKRHMRCRQSGTKINDPP